MSPAVMAGSQAQVGVLVANIGSPDALTVRAVRRYLAEFLGDRRIINLPRWLWLPILHGVILNTRPRRSARLYARIWTEQGSPLVTTLHRQAEGVHAHMRACTGLDIPVVAAARYSKPRIRDGLRQLRDAGVSRVLVFPLFPQYSSTTTASIYDAVFDELKQWRHVPELRIVQHYHTHPRYIDAVANAVREAWAERGRPQRLLFSFHGIPHSYSQRGDPYDAECQATAGLVAERLGVPRTMWDVSFQSRFGPTAWLQPYTNDTLAAWGHERLQQVHVVCPGFSADCLETLHEIDQEGREVYEAAGGSGFYYIPALNERPEHLNVLKEIALCHLQGWLKG